MKFNDYVKTSFRNLRRRKMRTFLTSFAVSIGAMLIILMVSLGVGVQKIVIDALKANTPGTTIAVSPYKLDALNIQVDLNEETDLADTSKDPQFTKIDESTLNKIRKMSQVDEIYVYSSLPIVNIELNGSSKKTSLVTAVDLNYSVMTAAQIDAVRIKEKNKNLQPISFGRMLSREDTDSALIGEKMLTRLGIKDFGSVIGKELTITAVLPDAPGVPKLEPLLRKVKIAGVINSKFPNGNKVVISMDTAKPVLAYLNLDNSYYEKKGPEGAIVIAKNLTDVETVSKDIENMGYGVTSIQSLLKGVKSVFSITEAVLSIIGIIIIFVASIGVINTMTMSIYERTRSIGILKALGASRREIRKLFIFESGVMGFIGGILGTLFSLINVGIIKFFLNSYLKSKGVTDMPKLFSTPIWLVLGTIGFAILISVLAGLYPAGRASRLDPVESLRYE